MVSPPKGKSQRSCWYYDVSTCFLHLRSNGVILSPGWGLSQMMVWRGFAVTLGWNTFFLILATVILKLRTWGGPQRTSSRVETEPSGEAREPITYLGIYLWIHWDSRTQGEGDALWFNGRMRRPPSSRLSFSYKHRLTDMHTLLPDVWSCNSRFASFEGWFQEAA